MRIKVFILLFFVSIRSYSQQFIEKNITTLEGLSSNIAIDVTWDKYGYLWISTEDGMNRFDGFNVLNFNDNSRTSEIFGHTSPIEIINNNYVYSNLSNELFFIGNDHFVHKIYLNKELLNTHSNWKLLYDFNLIVNKNYRQSEKLNELYHDIKINEEPIIIDTNRLLFKIKNNILEYDFLTDSINSIYSTKDEIKICKINEKNYFFNYKEQSFYEIKNIDRKYEFVKKIVPFQISEKIEKVFWRNGMNYTVVVSEGNIYNLNDKFQYKLIAKTKTNINHINSIKYNFNKDETVISTSNNGIFIYSRSPINAILNSNKNLAKPILYFNSHVEVSNNEIWGTKNTLFSIGDSVFNMSTDVPLFRSAFNSHDSLIFFQLIDKTLVKYNIKSKEYFTCSSIKPKEFYTSAFCKINNRYLNVSRYGVLELKNNSDTVIFKFDKNQNPNFAKDIAVLSSEKLLIGGGQGLFEFNLNSKKIKQIDCKIPLDINSIFVYEEHIFLCTYGQGLWLLKNGQLTQLCYDKYKYLQYVHSVFIDKNKIAWISTNNALLQTSFENLKEAVANKYSQLSCIIYDKTNYFPIVELNGATQGNQVLLNNGNLSLVGMNGFLQIDLNRKKNYLDSEIICVDKIVDNDLNEFHDDGNSFEIKNSRKSIAFTISSPTNKITHGQIIQYKLHNYGSSWGTLDLAKTNQIIFQNLPFGKYTLELIKQDVITGKSFSKKINFTVEIAWYFKWWVVAFWVFDLGVIIFLYVRWKTKKLKIEKKQLENIINEQTSEIKNKNLLLEEKIEKLEEYQEKLESNYAIKNKLIGVITHDLITPLNFINSNSSEILKNSKSQISDENYQKIKSISDSSYNMYRMSSNLIEWIKLNSSQMVFNNEEFILYDVVEEIFLTLKPLAQNKNNNLINKTQKDTIFTSKRAINILLFQLITNAIKYSEIGDIIISSEQKSDFIKIEITDEGKGFPKELHCNNANKINVFLRQNERGFGLYIINDLLEILNAKISILPNHPIGTKITIVV